MLEMMNAGTAPIGRGLARSVLDTVEHDMLDVDPPEDRHTVYWVTPEDGGAQHATLATPPETGGSVDTLGGHGPIEVPADAAARMRHTQRFCPDCFAAYLNLPGPTSRWHHTE
ncbi:hypothetical protein [Actinopolyspora xinjiangensis]|nr:hypothetical protein [Actinopolyspora xinjiangensis]